MCLIVTAWLSPNLFHLLLWEMQHNIYTCISTQQLIECEERISHFQHSVGTFEQYFKQYSTNLFMWLELYAMRFLSKSDLKQKNIRFTGNENFRRNGAKFKNIRMCICVPLEKLKRYPQLSVHIVTAVAQYCNN